MNKPWFKCWFGDAYKKLYPHRNIAEAENQVAFLFNDLQTRDSRFKIPSQNHSPSPLLPNSPSNHSDVKILDMGCGQGRHLDQMRNLGFRNCAGLDLSSTLLKDARQKGLRVVSGDMRHLPFPRLQFDLVTSFFTSFGYFPSMAEDVETLTQYVSVLKSGGYLFLDLINKKHLLKNLIPEDQRTVDKILVSQKRFVELDNLQDGQNPDQRKAIVVKEIKMQHLSGEIESFQERVRLYELSDMLHIAKGLHIDLQNSFGDEIGSPYDAEKSSRMALLFQKKE